MRPLPALHRKGGLYLLPDFLFHRFQRFKCDTQFPFDFRNRQPIYGLRLNEKPFIVGEFLKKPAEVNAKDRLLINRFFTIT